MRIGIFTDIHANLPALQKALDVFAKKHCDQIIHIGDLIGIGPYPKECMQLALSQKNSSFIMGNHDYWYAYGLPKPIPTYMSKEEVAHQKWTHQQLGDKYKKRVQKWDWSKTIKLSENCILNFRHYGLTPNGKWFKSIIKKPTAVDLDQIFEGVEATHVFYGHTHALLDMKGKRNYFNPGSAGCHNKSQVRLCILEYQNEALNLEYHSLSYDDNGLMEAFKERKVPARDFIQKVFIVRN